jgi:hypothetical protein
MKRKNYYLALLLFFSSLLVTSCDGFLEKNPLDQPSDVTFWSTESELQMAINAVYRSLYFTDRDVIHMPFQFLFDFSSDISWDRNLSVWQLIGQGAVTPIEESLIFGTWSNAYATIGQCNRILSYMERAKETTNPVVYARIAAEARFFRAYWYHWLISLYGSVPFTQEPLEIFDAKLPATPKDEIYAFILSELKAASEILPPSYGAADRGRVTKGAALALRARAALSVNDWGQAAESAKEVMDLNLYSLHPNYAKLFTYEAQNNSEEIFTIQFSRSTQLTHQTPVHTRGRLAGGFVTKIPTQALIDSYQTSDGLRIDQSPLYNPTKPFENRDPRLQATCVVPGSTFLGYQFETHPDSLTIWDYNQTPARRVANQEVTNPYATFSGYMYKKYVESDEREFRQFSELNIMLIRYAEILLAYAEAKIELNQVDESVLSAINLVRARAGMPAVKGSDQTTLREAIRYERKVEFAFEGHRYFDIRRWKIAEFVMPGQLYGRPLREYKAHHVPQFDAHGTPRYNAYASELRMFDTRQFNAQKDYLWPIPQKELDINPNLRQNPLY